MELRKPGKGALGRKLQQERVMKVRAVLKSELCWTRSYAQLQEAELAGSNYEETKWHENHRRYGEDDMLVSSSGVNT